MSSVKVAAVWAGLIFMSSVTAQAMEFDDRPGLSSPRKPHFMPAVTALAMNVQNYQPLPPGTPLFMSSVAVRAIKFDDPPRPLSPGTPLFTSFVTPSAMTVQSHEPLPPGTPLFMSSATVRAIKFDAPPRPLPPGTPLFMSSVAVRAIKFDGPPRPLPPGTPLFTSSVTPPAMKFKYRPKPVSHHLMPPGSVETFLPAGFAEFCAHSEQPCDPFTFAQRRAVLTPANWDDNQLLAHVNTSINFGPLSALHARYLPSGWHLPVAADHCNSMSLPKQRHLQCLGLPGETLKKAVVASPLFNRAGLIPRGGGRYKIGKAYRISGRLYRPQKSPNYDKTGTASWYGAQFHRRMTANGEWFDMEYSSAAHATMPLPSYARVTNLANGKEIIVRVNDRGPFVSGRIIDLSRKSAEILAFRTQGTAKVRVQYVGPAPLDDRGSHLAAMNRELERGTPLNQLIAAASGRRQQQAMVITSSPSFTE
jgi:rare lipoprotein A (peptidoglycan hydrolase)